MESPRSELPGSRRAFIALVGGAVAVAAAGCAAPRVVEMTADYPHVDGVGAAVRAADAVVVVEFLDSRSILVLPDTSEPDPSKNPQAGVDLSTLNPEDLLKVGVPSTVSRVKVTQSAAGDVPVGTVITVEQDGGTIDNVKYRESSTSLLSEAGYRDFVLILTKIRDGYRLVDPVLGVFGKQGDTVKLLKPNLVERASDRSIGSVQGILAAAGH